MKKNKDVPTVDVSFRITIDLINESELKRDYRSAQSELWFSAGFKPRTGQTLLYTISYSDPTDSRPSESEALTDFLAD